MTKQTPLYHQHLALGARIAPFGGYEMPVQYTGINAEHLAVRSTGGLFDVSHMGEFRISGPDALTFLQDVTVNDAAALEEGQAQYSAMCYSDGGIVDDLLLYRRTDHYFMVVNAANIDKDFEWLQSNIKGNVSLENESDQIGLIAVQGPVSRELVEQTLGVNLSNLPYYHSMEGKVYDRQVLISRTGYTGELGFELYTDPDTTRRLWEDCLVAGKPLEVVPAGLGARDTLRLEMKYCLYGNDISADTNPIEAGLGWITKLEKKSFIGSKAIAQVKEAKPVRRLVAIQMEERAIPRAGYTILHDDREIGRVTSGTQSPTLKRGIGLGYAAREHTKFGTTLQVDIRGGTVGATVVKPPFVKNTSLMA
ncbi:MAG: glycine cleavage system aminomethyltransferase GcvT [Fidelibacterota bacterium]|nr:MAG: glycine cleavage system aminomethyltransferase GcvT [Candidatus Neomarinimicrobiota bacterium]